MSLPAGTNFSQTTEINLLRTVHLDCTYFTLDWHLNWTWTGHETIGNGVKTVIELLYFIDWLIDFDKLFSYVKYEIPLWINSVSISAVFQCAATSKNLVSTLLPALKVAVEKDKTILAVKSLEKARVWITEIIDKVEQMVDR